MVPQGLKIPFGKRRAGPSPHEGEHWDLNHWSPYCRPVSPQRKTNISQAGVMLLHLHVHAITSQWT